MNASLSYDIFLSYASRDRPTIIKLADRLKADNFHVWLDEWEYPYDDARVAVVLDWPARGSGVDPGFTVPRWIDDARKALAHSRTTLFAVSSSSYTSEGMYTEYLLALASLPKDPNATRGCLVLVRLDNTILKDSLEGLPFVDWRNECDRQYARLVAACTHGRPPAVTLMTVLNNTLARLLRRYCTENGWSPGALADISGVDVAKISAVLSPSYSGKPMLSFDEIKRLLVPTGITIFELFGPWV